MRRTLDAVENAAAGNGAQCGVAAGSEPAASGRSSGDGARVHVQSRYRLNMPLDLVDLDTVRGEMLAEVDDDMAASELYLSPRLSPTGRAQYPGLLRTAIESGTDGSLALALQGPGLINDTEQRRTKSGYTTAKVPVTAPTTLAEGEFNRFYIRGVCRSAIADGSMTVTVYRARASATPRSESVALEGTTLDARALLDDLRTHSGVDTVLGLPPGPNSGLSVRL